jgi:hypothetical protein
MPKPGRLAEQRLLVMIEIPARQQPSGGEAGGGGRNDQQARGPSRHFLPGAQRVAKVTCRDGPDPAHRHAARAG